MAGVSPMDVSSRTLDADGTSRLSEVAMRCMLAEVKGAIAKVRKNAPNRRRLDIKIRAAVETATNCLLYERVTRVTEQKNLESIYGKTHALLEKLPRCQTRNDPRGGSRLGCFHSARARRVSDEDMQSLWQRSSRKKPKSPARFLSAP
jgi:hypothetical protein